MNLVTGQTLGGRYQILSQLGQGGFGATFLATDQHLPTNQVCVVKQLQPQTTNPDLLQTARRLFETEAQTLYRLGTYDQIPQLFAYFEENQEFYLVQEYIEGNALSEELKIGEPWPEKAVLSLLKEILEILAFVHSQNVIHRDVNPKNLIRRHSDGKLVLIDFGAVKQVTTQVLQAQNTQLTIAIGTQGYYPSEQASGHPQLSSDIYAVGMIAIQALTGSPPLQFPIDPDSGEIQWRDQANVTPEVANLIEKMVLYDFRQRYPSATEALTVVTGLLSPGGKTQTLAIPFSFQPPKRRSWIKIGAIAFLITGLGVGGGLWAKYFIEATNSTEYYNQGNILLSLNRYEDALDTYEKALELRPDYVEVWIGQGKALHGLERDEEALEAFDQAIQVIPNSVSAWMGRAESLQGLNRDREAIEAFETVLSLQPSAWQAWQGKGYIQMGLRQYAEAIASFEEVLKWQPDLADVWYQQGWALHNLGRYEEAVESYNQAVDLKPDYASAWYQRGNALVNLNDLKEAIRSYEQAVQFQKSYYPAWYSLGTTLSQGKQYEEAVAAYDQAVKGKADYAEAWYQRGWALHQLKRYSDAIASYEKAIQYQRQNSFAWYNKGNAYYNLDDYDQAVSAYDQAIAIKRDSYLVWNSRGNALYKLERYEDAIASYQEALRYQPNSREAQQGQRRSQRQLELTQSRFPIYRD